MVNNVVLIGRLVRDPELRTTTTGKNVCSFSIAVNKKIKPQDGSPDAFFFNIVAWNKDADYLVNYVTKGRLVSVEGHLQQRQYRASDGSNREVVEVVANSVQSLERPREDGGTQPVRQPAAASAPSADEYDPFADE